MEDSRPTIVRFGELSLADVQTVGVMREEAFSSEDPWIGVVTTRPGEMSGWHHHGDHVTYSFVVSGDKRIEYGPSGGESVVARPGDFIHVPKGLVHREGNPSAELSRSVAVRIGTGPATVNVAGPDEVPRHEC